MKEQKAIHLVKREDGSIYPADGESASIWSEMKVGTWKFIFSPVKVINRNVYFHRMYFSMMNTAFSNQERFPTVDSLREAVTIEAGFYDPLYCMDAILKKAKSIAFNKMDQENFEVLYEKSVDILMESFGWDDDMYVVLMSYLKKRGR
ncbi:MAG: DUF1367 family protein [Desulfobulbaceae bacterium]|jgi:hypothetical protein|nr:DUF1367 family protein [Desulfobulbaceae bacterium]